MDDNIIDTGFSNDDSDPAEMLVDEPETVLTGSLMPNVTDDLANDFAGSLVDLLREHAAEVGRNFQGDLDSIKSYTAQRMAHLATVIGEPGFDQALRAEKDSILLRAAGRAVTNADTIDQRLHAITQSVLTVGSRALLGLPPSG